MRNETIVLTDDQRARVHAFEQMLTGMEGDALIVEFTKRDGTESVLIGTMVDLYGGQPDKRVIRMDTDKGPRSANLYNVRSVRYAYDV